MEPQQLLASCMNCQLKCTENIQDHKGVHLKQSSNDFQIKVKALNSAATSKMKETNITEFFSDFFKQLEIIKSQNLLTIPQSYIKYLNSDIGIPKTDSSIIKKVLSKYSQYSSLTCAEIAKIDMLSKNSMRETDQRFIAYFINKIRYSVIGVFDQLAARYSGNILPMTPSPMERKINPQPPSITSNLKKNQPPRMEPPIRKPQESQQSYKYPRNIQKERVQQKQNQERKNRNPRDVRQQNNRDLRRPREAPRQPIKKDDDESEIHPDFILINKATNKHGKFTIKAKVLEFDVIPDKRYKVKLRDQSGKGTLIISSKKEIVPNQTIIVTQCTIGYYKNQKQIRANNQSEVYKASEELTFNQKSQSVYESQTSSMVNRQDVSNRRSRGRGGGGQRRGRGNRGRGRNQERKKKQQLTKIAEIEPGQVNYHLVVKIIKIQSIENEMIDCIVGDGSGKANAQFPESWRSIKQGESFVLYGIQASVINEHIVLTTVEQEYETESQTVRVSKHAIATHKIQSVNLENNISQKKWVPEE